MTNQPPVSLWRFSFAFRLSHHKREIRLFNP
nr:MAG TPA: hypothetical protein [Caudoviricetes sp.]